MTNSSLARQLCATMFIVTVCSAVTIQIQVEATILQEERRISWSGAGYPGDIPFVLNQVNVLDFGAIPDGVTDNASAIAAAIAAAPSPGVVFFPEGTYRFNSPIQLSSGIVLRGAGYKKTHLECNLSGAAQTCIQAVTYQRGDFTRILSGMSKGSTLLTVEDASNFTVGNPAEIQQENDPAIMYTNPEWNQSWAQNAVGQFVRITAINGNTLKLDGPLNIDFRADLNAMIRPNGLISDVGIEDLHIRRLDAGDGHTIQFKNAANSWVRRVESEYTYRTHVSVTSSMNIEIRDSYFHHSHDYGGGGHGYGVDLNHHTTNCLVENNIFERLRHAMMIHVGANGNVFGYNYSFDPVENSGNWMPPDISVHGHFPFMNLFEGNIVQEVGLSDWWGPAGPGNTLFRNRVETENIELKDHSHSQNVVGNELTGGDNQITIQSGVMDSLVHGNNVNGVINWDPLAEDHQLPNSYYLLSKPPFFGSTPWPSLGGDLVLDSGTIPSLERLLAGEPILPETALQIFVDVPPSHWASVHIETLFEAGYVAGCSTEPLMFCPDQTMTRAESAVFVERGIHGSGYLPAQPQGAVFEDVPLWEWFAKWADGLWTDGYTAGCGTDPLIFCPLFDHTRAEATVFFERMLHGNDFVPAMPTEGIYDDVPVGPEAPWYSKWISAAYNDNLLQDCEDDSNRQVSNFRPMDGLTRAEAACMMVRAKDQPPPIPVSGDGIWISNEEIRAIPIAGEPGCDSVCNTAWNNLVSASRDIGGGNIGDQNESDDVRTLAAAIVAVRTQDDELRGKVVQALVDIIGTDELPDSHCDHNGNASAGRPSAGARSLAIARNLTAYVIASDIIGLRPGSDNGKGDQWADYVDYLRYKPNCPNTGSGTYPDGEWFNLTETHNEAGSNANAQAGGARIAAALYLGDMDEVEKAWDTFKRYSGECGGSHCGFDINSSGRTWSFDTTTLAPINPANATKVDQNGDAQSIDGAIIADIGRGGNFKWPPGHTNYPWVGLEGYILQALILDRAGYPAWSVGDSAPYRTIVYLKLLSDEFGDQWWERTHWVKYVVNNAYGADFPTGAANSGHVMAWTDWTHRSR